MHSWQPYCGAEGYLDYPAVEAWCRALAAAWPEWVALEVLGTSREGRAILLVTVGDRREGRDPGQRPAVWLDGGTHAAEWAGVMATLYALSRWVELIAASAEENPFATQTAYVLPCMSPDGFQSMMAGGSPLRSTLRPPLPGVGVREGLSAQDVDGDGEVLWMRWFHPGGPFVDADARGTPRLRHLGDAPEAAYFLSVEGLFLAWDGVRWIQAPLAHGQDLNRNFPGHWAPFAMFGMDGGAYPLSEPESRAAMDAVAARPNIGAAITNHTFTGALLTQPYRADTPLSEADIALMERLGEEAVRETGYRLIRVHPDFTYDPKKPIVGVWADTLSTVLGVPCYTLELWDPFAWAGVEVASPATLFRKPDPVVLAALFQKAQAEPDGMAPWRPMTHPQLGRVEVGGLREARTIRNPPEALLPAECARAFAVVDRARQALPRLQVQPRLWAADAAAGALWLEVVVDNLGFLPTSGLPRGAVVAAAAPVEVSLDLPPGWRIVGGEPAVRRLGYLSGWGSAQVSAAASALYPALEPAGSSSRAVARWLLASAAEGGTVTVRWTAGRAGAGVVRVAEERDQRVAERLMV